MDKKEGLGDPDSNRAKGSEELRGRIIDKSYEIGDLLDATRKSWVFIAKEVGEISPGRDVALKVLKPGQEPKRKEQFAREVKTLADLESHPNIATVYGGGQDEEYFYIAMEYVPGDNLGKRVRKGETFSLERIVSLSHSLAEVVDFCHSNGIEHNDIKLKNLKEKRGEDGVCAVLDFGSKFTRDRDSDDVYAMGKVLEELLKHPENPGQNVPRKLAQIVVKSKGGDYETPEYFKKAIESYRKSITRRKFVKVAASVTALFGAGYSGYRYLDHINSIDRLVDSHENVSASDYETMNQFLIELREHIIRDKIFEPLEENEFLSEQAEASPEPLAPFAVDQNGNWFPDSINGRSGDFVNILLKAALFDQRHLRYTMGFLDKISNQEISDPFLKFYYSLAFASEIGTFPRTLTRDKRDSYKRKALEAAVLWSNNFNQRSETFSSVDDMEMSLLTLWALENSEGDDKEKFSSDLEIMVSNFTQHNIFEEEDRVLVFPYVEFGPNSEVERYVLSSSNDTSIPFTEDEDNYLIRARDSARLIQIYSLLGDHYSSKDDESNTDDERSHEYFRIAERLTNQHSFNLQGSNYFIGVEEGPIDNTYYAVLAKSVATLLTYHPGLTDTDEDSLTRGLYDTVRELTLPRNLRRKSEKGILRHIVSRITGIYRDSWIHGDKNLLDVFIMIPSLEGENRFTKLASKF